MATVDCAVLSLAGFWVYASPRVAQAGSDPTGLLSPRRRPPNLAYLSCRRCTETTRLTRALNNVAPNRFEFSATGSTVFFLGSLQSGSEQELLRLDLVAGQGQCLPRSEPFLQLTAIQNLFHNHASHEFAAAKPVRQCLQPCCLDVAQRSRFNSRPLDEPLLPFTLFLSYIFKIPVGQRSNPSACWHRTGATAPAPASCRKKKSCSASGCAPPPRASAATAMTPRAT